MLSLAKNPLFLVNKKEKEIPHADYSKVFKSRSAPRSAQDDMVEAFSSASC